MSVPPPMSAATDRAYRQLAQSALVALVLATVMAVLGPFLSYRSDVSQVRALFQARVRREALIQSEIVQRQTDLLARELERLASRSEMRPDNGTDASEWILLERVAKQSSLFHKGIAVVDAAGRVVRSEPIGCLPGDVSQTAWFRQEIANGSRLAVDSVWASGHALLVAVPLWRAGHFAGSMVGLADPAPQFTPVGAGAEALDVVVIDAHGDALLPTQAPPWAQEPDLVDQVERLLTSAPGAELKTAGQELFAVAVRVGDTGLRLVLVGDEQAVTAPVRRRFLLQLFVLSLLQTGAVVFLALYMRGTHRRFVALERGAVEQERLLSLGGAASLIAHEVRNSLNGLKAAVSLLPRSDPEAWDLPVRTLRHEVERLQYLATNLLQFGKPAAAHRRRVQLGELAAEVVAATEALPEREDVAVSLHIQDSLSISCDPLLFVTALSNLVRNAIEAGAVSRDVGRERHPRVQVSVVRDDTWAIVRVDDNAGGLAPEVRGRLFQPFVSGKAKGIGLGLSMARQAIEVQGGRLEQSDLPGGCRFEVRLPLDDAPDRSADEETT